MTEEANRLRLHAVIITAQAGDYCPSTSEVAYTLCKQLHLPRYNVRVSLKGLDGQRGE